MFQIGDKVLDKNGKIFLIDSIENKNFGSGDVPYFILTPCFPYDFTTGYKSFVPVEKSDTLLRPLLNKDEALTLIDSLDKLEVFPEINPRERKNYFAKIISSGNRNDICRVIKTLICYRNERQKINKPFSDFDRRLLDSLMMLLQNEMSIALDIKPTEVLPFIYDRTGISF